jgi:5-methylcytosine-specific restriction endonuclease McrA
MIREIMTCAEARAKGLKTYFTGKPCKWGHIANRNVGNGTCHECTKLADKPRRGPREAKKRAERIAKHDAKMREQFGDQYVSYVQAVKEGLSTYFTGEPCKHGHYARRAVSNRSCMECARLALIAWRIANEDEIRVYNRNHRIQFPEKHLEWDRNWRAQNPEASKANLHRRYARKRGAEGSYTGKELAALWIVQNHECAACHRDLYIFGHHVDHIIPLARGGSNWITNIQLLCPFCNLSKHDLTMDEFMERRYKERGES